MTTDNVSAEQLRLHIEALERLGEEKQGIADDMKERFALAKAEGFDLKTLRAILKLRKLEKHVREESDMLLETYRSALGLE